jgi:hypothetical protein
MKRRRVLVEKSQKALETWARGVDHVTEEAWT